MEEQGVPSQRLLIPSHAFKLFNRGGQCQAIGPIKKDAGGSLFNGFDGAASTIGDHGAARGIRFQGRHAKIFLAGKQQSATARGVVIHDGIRLPAKKVNAIVGERLQARAIRPIADDYQAAVQPLAGFDCQIDSLVRHQAREHQIVVVNLDRHLKSIDVNRRRNDERFAAVNLLDSVGDQT